MTELTYCQAKNSPRSSRPSASFQLQLPWGNLQPVKPRIPQEHQDCQLHSSSSYHEVTYILSCQEFHKSIKTVSFIPALATMMELTNCQANNSPRASRLLTSFQLQPPWGNLQTVKPRIPQEHQDCQLHSSSSHHQRTYLLSSQEWPKTIKIISFISAPATMTELTDCQPKNAQRASRPSASFQLHPPLENLQTVNQTMTQDHQDHQLHSSSSHHDRTYRLSTKQCHKNIGKTVSSIPALSTMAELTDCQARNAPRVSRLSASF